MSPVLILTFHLVVSQFAVFFHMQMKFIRQTRHPMSANTAAPVPTWRLFDVVEYNTGLLGCVYPLRLRNMRQGRTGNGG